MSNFNASFPIAMHQLGAKNQLKLVKISDPDNLIKTIFVWPEGVFSGYSYNEILQFFSLILFHKDYKPLHLAYF